MTEPEPTVEDLLLPAPPDAILPRVYRGDPSDLYERLRNG